MKIKEIMDIKWAIPLFNTIVDRIVSKSVD